MAGVVRKPDQPILFWSHATRQARAYGFFATTLPFSHTYSGVPYIRAVLRASFAARHRARPTPAAKDSDRVALGRFLDFTEAFSPAFVEPSRVLQGERLTQKRPSDIPQWGLPKRAQVIDFMVAREGIE